MQLATLGGGMLAAVAVATVVGGGRGFGAAVVIVAATISAACWPVAGRPPVAWAPIVTGWVRRRAGGPARVVPGSTGRWVTAPPGIRVIDAPRGPGETSLGVVRDDRAGTWAAVVAVHGRSFTLLDPADQRRRLAAWGALLSGVARDGTPVARLQWLERVTPADPDALLRDLDRVGVTDTPARSAYLDLVTAAGAAAQDHETLVVVAVRGRRRGRRPGDAPGAVLRRELRLVEDQLRAAELTTGPALDTAALGGLLRAGFDPDVAVRSRRGPWPMATDEDWSALRADGGWHATYWIAEWPRVEVGPDFLVPLLVTGGRRAVSVVMAPVPSARATRRIESARTARVADDELRRRAGFLATARRQREGEGEERRESELAEGHTEYRFSGYVTVSGADRAALDASCAQVEQAARAARLELRRLWGQQLEAFTWTLPLARGLAP